MFSFIANDQMMDQETYYTFYPVKIGNSISPWSFGISVPTDIILTQAHEHLKWTLSILFTGILLLTIIISLISNNITSPLKDVYRLLVLWK